MMKYKWLGVIGLTAILAACDNAQKSDNNTIARQCGDYYVEMSVNDTGDSMRAVINGDSVDLALAVAASGARYVGVLNDTDVTLWSKGDAWTMFLNDEAPIECTVK